MGCARRDESGWAGQGSSSYLFEVGRARRDSPDPSGDRMRRSAVPGQTEMPSVRAPLIAPAQSFGQYHSSLQNARGRSPLLEAGRRSTGLPRLLRKFGPPELRHQSRQIAAQETPDLLRFDFRVLMDEVVTQPIELVPRNAGVRIPKRSPELRGRLREMEDPQLRGITNLRETEVEESRFTSGGVSFGRARFPQHSVD
jgi:hypothetical protein